MNFHLSKIGDKQGLNGDGGIGLKARAAEA